MTSSGRAAEPDLRAGPPSYNGEQQGTGPAQPAHGRGGPSMAPGGSTSDSDDMQLLQRLLHIPLQCQAVGQPEKALHECACLLGETLNLHVSINWAADGPYPGPPAEGSVTLEVSNEEEPFALIRLHGSLPDSEAL